MNMRTVRFRRKGIPQLNTASTGDISFMLLIFFLVTTSMDIDKGLTRQLPPEIPKEEQMPTDVKEGTVMRLVIDGGNKLICDGREIGVGDLRERVETFVRRIGKEHIIQLEADRRASYDTYFQVQNEIVAAYNRLRDDKARADYHHSFAECSDEEQQALREAVPQRIAEVYSTEKGGAE